MAAKPLYLLPEIQSDIRCNNLPRAKYNTRTQVHSEHHLEY